MKKSLGVHGWYVWHWVKGEMVLLVHGLREDEAKYITSEMVKEGIFPYYNNADVQPFKGVVK
jgi:hypothetical protein